MADDGRGEGESPMSYGYEEWDEGCWQVYEQLGKREVAYCGKEEDAQRIVAALNGVPRADDPRIQALVEAAVAFVNGR